MLNEIKNNNDQIEYLVNDSYVPDHDSVMNCARLAADVYNDSGAPLGWQRYAQIKTDSGYFGAVYISPERRSPLGHNIHDIYFAHRGTSSFLDLIADISVFRERPFQQIYDAVNFVFAITKKTNTNICENIYHTGHSLGAIMSDICGNFMCFSIWPRYLHGRSITFENPGSKNIAAQAYPKLIKAFPSSVSRIDDANAQNMINYMQSNCYAFQSPINIINSCNEQIGTVIRLADKEHHIDKKYAKLCIAQPFSISAHWETNLAYLKINTLDQHSINPIIDYLNANRRQVVENNPVHGLNPTYKEFLNVATNGKYWNDYFTAIWDILPPPKGEYLLDDFIKAGLSAVKSAHDYKSILANNLGFVIIPNLIEKQSIFAVQPKESKEVVQENKSTYCNVM